MSTLDVGEHSLVSLHASIVHAGVDPMHPGKTFNTNENFHEDRIREPFAWAPDLDEVIDLTCSFQGARGFSNAYEIPGSSLEGL